MTDSGLGIIVNDRDGQDKSNDRSDDFNLDEAVVPVRMPHNIFNKLVNAAEFYGYPSLESYIMAKMVSSLDTKVGEATISAPSNFSGQETRKITGPSHSGLVSRG